MDAFAPAVTHLALECLAGKSEPLLVEVSTQLIRAGHPDHYGRGLRHQSEAFFTFTQGNVCPLAGQGVGEDLAYQTESLHDLIRPIAVVVEGTEADGPDDGA